jgi:hypothetical protein
MKFLLVATWLEAVWGRLAVSDCQDDIYIYIYLLSTECIPGNISKPTISSQLATADQYMYSFSISISTTYVCDPDQRSHYREIPYLPLFFDHTPTLDICLTVFFEVLF